MELQYYYYYYNWVWMSAVTLLASYLFLFKFVSKLNGWYYDHKLGHKKHLLPPGDMGWPFLGNMIQFYFFPRNPDSFLNTLISRYGEGGMYKTHLFLRPTVMVCTAEACRRVLADDVNFDQGYPSSIQNLSSNILNSVTREEHRQFRRLVTLPIVGFNTLSMYMELLEENIKNMLQKISKESKDHPVELLTEFKYCALKSIVDMFIGSHNLKHSNTISALFLKFNKGAYSFPIRLPGFAFYEADKSRKKLQEVVQAIVDERRETIRNNGGMAKTTEKKDLIDILLDVRDEITGRKVEDQDIIDTLVLFLFAGHESTGINMQLTTTYLMKHPHVWKKAKEEQEQIMKERPASQTHLSIEDIKKMNYLNMVIDETLRNSSTFAGFRRALDDVEINGYIIPKGWIALVWSRGCHMNPKYFSNPDEFDPSRWENHKQISRAFFPFGAGPTLCPGRDLAKLEIRIFLHHFLLNYKAEVVNPECPVATFPAACVPKDKCLAKLIKLSDT